MPIAPDKIKTVKAYLIAEDRPCVKCGYNLLGLMSDGVCPECGRKIHIRRKDIPRYADNLVNAPTTWLAVLATGSTILFLASIGVFFAAGAAAWLTFKGVILAPLVAGGFALFWCLGVWVVTRPRPVTAATIINPLKEWRVLRWSARVSQLFWMATAALLGLYVQSSQEFFAWMAIPSFAIAAVGMIPLCILVSNIAYWGSDSALADHFRMCAWTVGAAALLITLHVLNVASGTLLLGGFWGALVAALLLFFAVAPFFYAIFCCFQLQGMARWALLNHVHADAKDDRLREKAEISALQGAPPSAHAGDAIDLSAFKLGDSTVDDPAQDIARRPQGHVLKPRPHDPAPYDIERRRPGHMGDEP